MAPARDPPIVLEPAAPATDPSRAAALIFLHGLADDAAGVCNIGEQIQAAGRLGHVRFVFPNAEQNRDMMCAAWYAVTQLPGSAPRPELQDDEDEDGLLRSARYVEGLIDEQVARGVPPARVVLAGFSQGMAMALLVGLTSGKYAGQLGGVLGIGGYLPLQDKVLAMREENGVKEAGQTKWCLMRGKADRLVSGRYAIEAEAKLAELGYGEDVVVAKEYEGVAHSINGAMIGDISEWVATVTPP